MDDFDEFLMPKKENRRKKLTTKTHALESGPPALGGIHELERKVREKLEKKKLEELLRKG